MQAVVLVGGFGTRLRPLTNSIPKPMLPVGHVPIIERLVRNLALGGITDVVLALGFKPEPFLAAFPDGTVSAIGPDGTATVVHLRYAVEPQPLDTAGAIRFAAEWAGIDQTFVVANGDIVTDLDVAALVQFHRDRNAQATLHLTSVDDPSTFGVVQLDADGRVLQFVEKPAPGTEPSNLINAGTYVLEPSVLDAIAAGEKVSIERVVFPALVAAGQVFAHATDDYWLDTGTIDLFRQANLDVLAVEPHPGAHVDASIHQSAVITNSVVDALATVDAGAQIRDSVILAGGHVGSDAVVVDSIIMGVVGSGARVINSVLGADGVVAADEQIEGERRPVPEPS